MAVHIQIGRLDAVAAVFSCPGRFEELAGYPAARTTGKNLVILLSLLAEALGRDDLTRENVTVTNAWPQVEYPAKTGRSEASEREVLAPQNLRRLEEELAEVTDFVLFFGERARAAGERLRLPKAPRLAYARHLGTRGLLSIRTDVHGRPIISSREREAANRSSGEPADLPDNTRRRLEVVAASIAAQLA